MSEVRIVPVPYSRGRTDVVADPAAGVLGRGTGRSKADVPLATAGHLALVPRRGTLWLEADPQPSPRRAAVAVSLVTRTGDDDVHTLPVEMLTVLADTVGAAGERHAEVAAQLRAQAEHVEKGGRASWSPLASLVPVGSGDGFFRKLLHDISILP